MANLVLNRIWENGIYQIETSDPVVGGAEGISNKQAKQLGNRTEYLKQEVDKKSATESPIFTGVPRAPTAGRGTNTTQLATTAFVTNAVKDLRGNAPTALNTLEKIATALTNDTNSRQALTTELDKKANLTHSHQWSEIEGKPETFPAATHNHSWTSITGKPTTFPATAHNHSWDSITGKPTTFPATAHNHSWDSITGKPTTFPATAHNHSWDSITGKPTTFPAATHSHSWDSITGKPDFVRKSGDTMRGHLTIESNSDYSSIRTRNRSNEEVRWESRSSNDSSFAKVGYFVEGRAINSIGFPKKTGTMALVEDFTYQKTGNFEIRRYPDGTMIQTYKHKNPRGTTNNHRTLYQFNWAVSFTVTPLVWVTQSSDANTDSQAENDNVAATINTHIKINHFKSSGGVCAYWDFNVEGDGNGREMNWDFLAIGRWK